LNGAPDAKEPQALWQLGRDTVHDFADVSHATEAIRDERRRLRAVDELTIEQHFGIDAPNGLGLIAEFVARHGPSVFTSEGLSQLAALHADAYARQSLSQARQFSPSSLPTRPRPAPWIIPHGGCAFCSSDLIA
jgi:hypothetical protein